MLVNKKQTSGDTQKPQNTTKPSGTADKTTKASAAKTGDMNNYMLFAVMALAAGAVSAVSVRRKRINR